MKNFKGSNSTDGAAVATRRLIPRQSGKAAGAVLLTLALTMGISGCSHSKEQAANSIQKSSTQSQLAQAVAPALPVGPTEPVKSELAAKKSVKGPVKKLPAMRTYNDQVSGLSFTYPRRSMLELGDKAEQDGVAAEQLPMNFVQGGGVTMAVVELPGIAKSGSDFTPALFAISVNKELTAEQCGQFVGQESSDKAAADSAGTPALSNGASKLSIGSVDYVELDKQTDYGAVKYYHRFVPGTGADDNACYEFAMSVKSAEPKRDDDKTASSEMSSMSDVERKAAFAQLEKIFVSVKIGSQNKSDAIGTLKAEATKEDNAKESTSQAPGTDAAKTAEKLEQNPR